MLMNIHGQLLLQICLIISMASGDLSSAPEVKDMAIANTRFTFDLLRWCAAQDKGQNAFFAPYSISTALAMTCLGATGNTAKEMMQVLKWAPSGIPKHGFASYLAVLNQGAPASSQAASSGYILEGAQRIYMRKDLSIKPKFSEDTKHYFASQAMAADFGGNAEGERSSINSWVEEQTRNKIKELLPPGSINSLTAMVLVQAIYFKGNWEHQFDVMDTRPAEFFTPQGQVQVNMMQQMGEFNFGASEELDCTAVELPYASNNPAASKHDLSMLILLPNARDGLEKLEASVTNDTLNKLQTTMRSVEVDLRLPRFSVESSFKLKDALIHLGMPLAFSDNADFSGMAETELRISDVFHKAVVEVNEEGTEAAAAIAGVQAMRSIPVIEPFTADHPFLFFIVDQRASMVLFSGRLVNPPTVAQSQHREDL